MFATFTRQRVCQAFSMFVTSSLRVRCKKATTYWTMSIGEKWILICIQNDGSYFFLILFQKLAIQCCDAGRLLIKLWAFTCVCNIHETKILSNILFVRHKFFKCKMQEGDNLLDHINKINLQSYVHPNWWVMFSSYHFLEARYLVHSPSPNT